MRNNRQRLFSAVKEASKELHDHDYKPDTLIADSAAAITNGFKHTFSSMSKRGNCWAHVIRNIDIRLKPIKEPLHSEIRHHLLMIQQSFSEKVFKKSISLFLRKYAQTSNTLVAELCTYLEKGWFKDATWYEGYLPGLPSTSNNIESFHRNGLKDKGQLMTRLSMLRFLNAIMPIVRDWSLDRSPKLHDDMLGEVNNPNVRTFATKPTITAEDYIAAQKWDAKGKKVVVIGKGAHSLCFAPTGEKRCLSKEECFAYIRKIGEGATSCNDLDEWLTFVGSMVMVQLNTTTWELSTCTCARWLKDFKCHHVIAIAYRANLCDFKSVIMDLPLERKRLRGAKKATKPCLLRQSIEAPPTYTGLEYVDEEPTSAPKPKVGRPKRKQPEETIAEEQAVEQAVEQEVDHVVEQELVQAVEPPAAKKVKSLVTRKSLRNK